MSPPIGTCTEADLARTADEFGIWCELVDGTLVTKAERQWPFSHMEASIGAAVDGATSRGGERQGAVVWGATLRCRPATVRRPDIPVFAVASLVAGVFPPQPRAGALPDLVIDIHMIGNTPAEMARRRLDYFAAGVTRVWSIHPAEHTVTAHTGPQTCAILSPDRPAMLGDTLPGACVTFRPLFDQFANRWAVRASRPVTA